MFHSKKSILLKWIKCVYTWILLMQILVCLKAACVVNLFLFQKGELFKIYYKIYIKKTLILNKFIIKKDNSEWIYLKKKDKSE